ncbi:hypothetical protein HanXRQr2_Chr10g0425801 [Helianthus annuus]|uniref:Uncharacterized protein n=1 Tax=Helianthus annuus TaxID=4232 RepID=A0A9K3HV79_HELAN|nr:hypothetical protein HanXRQr2_Chr10g0425801 [Helianthus annuus]
MVHLVVQQVQDLNSVQLGVTQFNSVRLKCFSARLSLTRSTESTQPVNPTDSVNSAGQPG